VVVRLAVSVAAVLLWAFGVAGAPSASAAPQPGAPCTANDSTSPDGSLACSHQAMIWMHAGLPLVGLGQPCTTPGDVTYAAREQIVTCRQTESGLAWEP
jgi:invasion protein IalB